MLVLRNPLDHRADVTTGVKTAALLGRDRSRPAPAPVVRRTGAAAASPPPDARRRSTPPSAPPRTVEAIRAAKRTEEVIK